MVNDTLARHAAANTEPALQHLAISLKMRRLLPLCFEAAQEWIRDAVRSEVVKSFVLDLLYWPGYDNTDNNKEQRFVVALGEDLPSSSKMETMRLALDNATVPLPATATSFTALVDLSLEYMEFAGGNNGQLLSRLLSSACCPCLRKLSLREIIIGLDDELLLESQTLLELSMEDLYDKYVISLRTPSLRVLRVNYCDLDVLKLSAPRLEEILVFDEDQPSYRIDIDGELPCVRSLKVKLSTHALLHDHDYIHEGDDDEDTNDVGIRLLNCCTSAASLQVGLYATQSHNFKTKFLCDHPDRWNSDEVYLPHLEEAEFTMLVGTDCEFRFMQSVLTNTRQLRKATVSFNPHSLVNRVNAVEPIQPPGGGMWTSCDEAFSSFEWKPCL
ncbi:unnamed protein product [Urochloa decumbens]|uniref:Uncharacterized protein n=1 Tax=Urochloa decumbens TaxID=240449 RepID=A0ABC9D1Z0_9POAL